MAEGSIAPALCSYWKKKSSQEDLLKVAAKVDQDAWRAQADAGIDLVGLDGTLYDQACALPKLLNSLPTLFNAQGSPRSKFTLQYSEAPS